MVETALMPSFAIGGRAVGRGEPPYVIAEAGVHHGNDVGLACRYVEAAHEAGADAIKFQTYTADRLVARWAPTYWEDDEGRTQHEIFAERSLLTEDDYRRVARRARDLGITFLSTPFDPGAAAMLDRLAVAAFKIASADVTHLPLLRAVASFSKPVLLSTGASSIEEVRQAVDALAPSGAPVALLHCSLAYPTPVGEANLRRIELLGREFPNHVVGYSDHTLPEETELACPLAVALGASIVEKHFTLDRSLPGDDHYHAVDPDGLARMVAACRQACEMAPVAEELRPREQAARTYARRSVVAARTLAAGQILTEQDIDFKRPGTGVAPGLADHLVGRRLVRPLAPDELIRLEDVE